MTDDSRLPEAYADLYYAARVALRKMRGEYHQAQPDAEPEECWAEAEALQVALERVEEIGGYSVREPSVREP